MKKLKLSVITICYNIKNDILKTIESVINQTSNDFEWIVVDGASTDGTTDILEQYKSHISHFISEKDTGIYNAMNKGIQSASGEYLLFLNGGDCFASNDIVEEFNNLTGRYQFADVIYGNTHEPDKNNALVLKPIYGPINLNYFKGGRSLHHPSTFIKKELFEKYGLYDETLKIVSDWKQWIIFALNNASFIYWDKPISIFDTTGISSQKSPFLSQEINSVWKEYGALESYYSLSNFKRVTISLFNCIPLLEIKKKKHPLILSVRLFGFLNCCTIKETKKDYQIYLFECIPFLKIKGK